MTTLRQLEYLTAVVDTDSFTAAAELLHVTQPGLSSQVQALERALGGRLLERLPRGVHLTPLGREVLPHARAALADAGRVRAAARRVLGLDGGELHVAALYSLVLGVLPAVLHTWREAHPQVRVRLHEHRSAGELHAGMAAGRADVGLGPPPPGWEGTVRTLGTEEFVVLLPPGQAPPGGGSVRLRDLADRPWVHFAPDNGLSAVLDAACARESFSPVAAVRLEQTAAAAPLVAAGLGPALLPANVVPGGFGGHVRRPDPPVRREVCAFTRQDPDPLAAAFTELLAATARL
ncbi:LysR family transcriptional regulator [Kineococcus sp. NUM-3379]